VDEGLDRIEPARIRQGGSQAVPLPPGLPRGAEREKFDRLIRFGQRLPELRAAAAEHLDWRELLAVPGTRVFRYESDGELCDLTSRTLNEYVKEYLGLEFTAKDFHLGRAAPRCDRIRRARACRTGWKGRNYRRHAAGRGAAGKYASRLQTVVRGTGRG